MSVAAKVQDANRELTVTIDADAAEVAMGALFLYRVGALAAVFAAGGWTSVEFTSTDDAPTTSQEPA